MKTAMTHYLLSNDLIEDEELLELAQDAMKAANDSDYSVQISLDESLDKRVVETFISLDKEQRELAFRDCMRANPNWTPRRDEFLAVLDKMQAAGTIPDRLKKVAARRIRQEMDSVNLDEGYGAGQTEQDEQRERKLEKELTVLVNTERSKINQDDLDTLIQSAKDNHPQWAIANDPLEVFDEFSDGIEEFRDGFKSDGTFGSSWASRFKLNDIIWFALGLASCFAIVFTLGKSNE